MLAAEIIGNYTGDQSMEIFTQCLPCLLVIHSTKISEQIQMIGLLLNSKLTDEHAVLTEIKTGMFSDF